MTKHPSVSTTNVPDDLETVSSDELSSASGGLYRGWDGNTGWAGGWTGNTGGYGGWQPQHYTVQRGDNLTNIARSAGYSLNDLLRFNPQYRKNPNLIHPGEHVLTGVRFPWS